MTHDAEHGRTESLSVAAEFYGVHCMLNMGRVVVMRPNRPPVDMLLPTTLRAARLLKYLPQYKIDKQRFARVLRDPVQSNLLTVATVTSCEMP